MPTPAKNNSPRPDAMRSWVLVPIVTSVLLTLAAIALLLANR
ncbi:MULTISPECIES: hypothetical protein [Mycolicibacterium]|uniref:Uncharacterized protein n=1 Tax=Mycolicibacterium neoaurum TaxID=1795 RepID=A0AAV2WJK8_MYCNE|nr:hypothetical protein [Mycolicibacterium neoaurum]CDQ43988.1 hypothetical protein BN1047_01864 [Mycolicibacterium neoaurum]SDE27552.1 hypothetical protein SAMN04488581_3743 [Mycolicibacterium neoaurum]